jgi:glycosyltransferase involved in cell wall biosynthesis
VPPRDAGRLAETINEALALGEKQRLLLARRAIAHVASRYTRQAMCARTIEVYEELLFPESWPEGSESQALFAALA